MTRPGLVRIPSFPLDNERSLMHPITGAALLRRCLLAATTALLLGATPASAQLGGWVKKKVAERVVDRADKAVDQIAPTSGPGTPFTADELDRVLGSLELAAAARVRADSIGKAADPLRKRVTEIHQSHSEQIAAHGKAKIKLSECRDAVVKSKRAVDDPKSEAAARKIAELVKDPEKARQFGQEGVRMQRVVAEAVERGDQATAERAQREFYGKFGVDMPVNVTEADLARQCGGPPPVPPVLAERDSLQHLIAELETRRRAAQATAQDSARIASRLPQQQYFVMTERVERWYAIAVRNEKGPRFWTDEENALFEAQRARIERLFARRG
jgi:hypothetical protein